tara:strand:+ start:18801 stop:18995 length:195 start_codon:yes stop_codon:yes gene_type:complete
MAISKIGKTSTTYKQVVKGEKIGIVLGDKTYGEDSVTIKTLPDMIDILLDKINELTDKVNELDS